MTKAASGWEGCAPAQPMLVADIGMRRETLVARCERRLEVISVRRKVTDNWP